MSELAHTNLVCRPARFPIFAGGVFEGGLRLFSSVGRATRPFDDNYFHIRLWMYPRTAFHLVKHDEAHGRIHYGFYGRMRTEKHGQPVFENPLGEGIVLPSSNYVAIQLHFPKDRVFLRLSPWDPSIDEPEVVYRPGIHPSEPVKILRGFRKLLKTQN